LLYLLMLKQVHSDVLDDGNEHSMYKPCTTAYNLEIFTFFSGFSDRELEIFNEALQFRLRTPTPKTDLIYQCL